QPSRIKRAIVGAPGNRSERLTTQASDIGPSPRRERTPVAHLHGRHIVEPDRETGAVRAEAQSEWSFADLGRFGPYQPAVYRIEPQLAIKGGRGKPSVRCKGDAV